MNSIEVALKAYDVLEAALQAGDVQAAVEPMRLELEVLSREDLVRVSMAIAAEVALKLTPAVRRGGLLQRVQHARVAAMWAGS